MSLIFGLVVAFGVHMLFERRDSRQQELARSVKRSEQVFQQYEKADYDTARQAMLDHIERLDKSSSRFNNPARTPYSADAMAWYVRLAKLEERNNKPAKVEYIQEATERCKKLGWADCSEENLRRQVDRMDKIALVKDSNK